MKKVVKITSILGIVFCLVGVGMITAGAMMYDDKQIEEWMDDLDITKEKISADSVDFYTEISGNVYQGIQKIEIESALGWVEIHTENRSDPTDTSIRVEIFDENGKGKNPYEIVQEHDELKIKNRRAIHGDMENHHEKYRVDIFVPENYTFEAVEVDIAAGAFSTAGIAVQDLELHLATGQMSLGAVQADYVEIECVAGSIDMEVTGKKTDYNYEIGCAAGEVTLKEDTFKKLHKEEKIQNGAKKSVDIECVAGNVYVSYTEE